MHERNRKNCTHISTIATAEGWAWFNARLQINESFSKEKKKESSDTLPLYRVRNSQGKRKSYTFAHIKKKK